MNHSEKAEGKDVERLVALSFLKFLILTSIRNYLYRIVILRVWSIDSRGCLKFFEGP